MDVYGERALNVLLFWFSFFFSFFFSPKILLSFQIPEVGKWFPRAVNYKSITVFWDLSLAENGGQRIYSARNFRINQKILISSIASRTLIKTNRDNDTGQSYSIYPAIYQWKSCLNRSSRFRDSPEQSDKKNLKNDFLMLVPYILSYAFSKKVFIWNYIQTFQLYLFA